MSIARPLIRVRPTFAHLHARSIATETRSIPLVPPPPAHWLPDHPIAGPSHPTLPHFKPAPHKLCTQLQTSSAASLKSAALPYSPTTLSITSILLRHGLVSSLTLGTHVAPDPRAFEVAPIPARRIWVDLKYRGGMPVLRKIRVVSKGSMRVVMDRSELGRVLVGKRARNVSGCGLGEVVVVRTQRTQDGRGGDYMEGWEAWRAGLGGEVICRAG